MENITSCTPVNPRPVTVGTVIPGSLSWYETLSRFSNWSALAGLQICRHAPHDAKLAGAITSRLRDSDMLVASHELELLYEIVKFLLKIQQ